MTRDINQSWGSGVEDTSSPFLFSPLHGCSSDTVSLAIVSELPVVTGMVGPGVGALEALEMDGSKLGLFEVLGALEMDGGKLGPLEVLGFDVGSKLIS